MTCACNYTCGISNYVHIENDSSSNSSNSTKTENEKPQIFTLGTLSCEKVIKGAIN